MSWSDADFQTVHHGVLFLFCILYSDNRNERDVLHIQQRFRFYLRLIQPHIQTPILIFYLFKIQATGREYKQK